MRYIIVFLLVFLSSKVQSAEYLAGLQAQIENSTVALKAVHTAAAGHVAAWEEERVRADRLTADLARSEETKSHLEARTVQLARDLTAAEGAKTAIISVRDALASRLVQANTKVRQLETDISSIDKVVKDVFASLGKESTGNTTALLTTLLNDVSAGKITNAVAEPVEKAVTEFLAELEMEVPTTFQEKVTALVTALPDKLQAAQKEIAQLNEDLRSREEELAASQAHVMRLTSELSAAQLGLTAAQSTIADLMRHTEEVTAKLSAVASPVAGGTVGDHVTKALGVKSVARRSAETARQAAEAAEREARATSARLVIELQQAAARSQEEAARAAALEARLKEFEALLAERDKDNKTVKEAAAKANQAAEAANQVLLEAKAREIVLSADLAEVRLKAELVTPLKTRITRLEEEVGAIEGKRAALQADYDAQTAALSVAQASLMEVREAIAAATSRVGDLEAQLAEARAKTAMDAELIASLKGQLDATLAARAALESRLGVTQAEVDAKTATCAAHVAQLEAAKAQEDHLNEQLEAAQTQVRAIRDELSSVKRGRDARAASAERNKARLASEERRHELTREELSALRSEMERVVSVHADTLKTVQEEASQALAREKSAQEEIIAKLKAGHTEQLRAAETAHAAAVAALGEGHTAEVEALNRRHEAAMKTISDEHTQAIERAAATAKTTLDTMELDYKTQLKAAKEKQVRLAAKILILKSINQKQQRQFEELKAVELPRLQAQQEQILRAEFATRIADLSSEHRAALQVAAEAKNAVEAKLVEQDVQAREKEAALSAQIAENQVAMAAATAAFEAAESDLRTQIADLEAKNTASTASADDLTEQVRKAQEELTTLTASHALQVESLQGAAGMLQRELVELQASHAAEKERFRAALAASEARLSQMQAMYAAEKADLAVQHAAAVEDLGAKIQSYESRLTATLAALDSVKADGLKTNIKHTIVLARSLKLQKQMDQQKLQLKALANTLAEREAALVAQETAFAAQTHDLATARAELVAIRAEKQAVLDTLAEVRTSLESREEAVRTLNFEQEALKETLEQERKMFATQAATLTAKEDTIALLSSKLTSFQGALSNVQQMIKAMAASQELTEFMTEDAATDLTAESSISPTYVFGKVVEYYTKVIDRLQAGIDALEKGRFSEARKAGAGAASEVEDGGSEVEEDSDSEIAELVGAPMISLASLGLVSATATASEEATTESNAQEIAEAVAGLPLEIAALVTPAHGSAAPHTWDSAAIAALLAGSDSGLDDMPSMFSPAAAGGAGATPLTARPTHSNVASPVGGRGKPVVVSAGSGSPNENTFG